MASATGASSAGAEAAGSWLAPLSKGRAGFAATGTEQDAFAEYLQARYNPANGGSAFAMPETVPADDTRIVNLAARRAAQ